MPKAIRKDSDRTESDRLDRTAEAGRLLLELERRANRHTIDILDSAGLFDRQIEFIRDPAKRKLLFMPRRSGKSTALGIYLLQEALRFPNRKFLYLGLTSKSVTNIIWKDIIQKEMKRLKLIRPRAGRQDNFFDEHRATITLPNGSQIILCGLDSSPQRVKTLVGGKYHMCIIDETQDIKQDIEAILAELGPAVSDYTTSGGGIIVLAGIPGERMGDNLWWRLTKQDPSGAPALDRENQWTPEKRYGWKMFRWAVSDNPHQVEAFSEKIIEFRERLGDAYTSDPEFRRQWLGHWVLDSGSLVYAYSDPCLLARDERLPDYKKECEIVRALQKPSSIYTYMAGVDLGYIDATAIVVVAFSRTDKALYVVHTEKLHGAVINQIGARLVDLTSRYNLSRIVVDTGAGGKLTAESLRQIYGLPCQAASREDKKGAVSNLNSDFRAGLLRIIPESNKPLIDELATHLLDRKKIKMGEWGEDKLTENHCCDALLYAHRESLHHHAIVPTGARPESEYEQADRILHENRLQRLEQKAYSGSGSKGYDRIESSEEIASLIAQYGMRSNNGGRR